MHYFSPVEKMPLLEVIATPQTADWVVATAVAFGKSQGKTVIVVGDGPGFYTTRILGPYLNEAAFALLQGHAVEDIDRALVEAGFPVGPLALLDEIGIDVGQHVSETLERAFGARMRAPAEFVKLVDHGRLGRKAQRGFYSYSPEQKGKRPVDPAVYTELGITPRKGEAKSDVAERCALAMINEAFHCLGEGVLRSERDGDLGAVFGLGFPPFWGGPFHYVERHGAAQIVERLQKLAFRYGERFEPAPLLLERARVVGTTH
jgi:3-hydroxyacyl-CoA dehydrogenase/enoyl-CoA hydratase/3-hydroxybutyryl-CoA epimerase